MSKHKGWVMKEWTANVADPTAVTSWTWKWWKLDIRMVGSWGIELKIWWGGKELTRQYDTWLAKKLWELAERNRKDDIEDEYGFQDYR